MMKRILPAIAAALLGFGTGVVVASHVWIQFARATREASRAEYIHEQLSLSNRAGASGDEFAAARHAMSAADAEAGVGFRWVERTLRLPYWQWWTQPWGTSAEANLLLSTRGMEEVRQGERLVGALYRAQAAAYLERSTCPSLAEFEWNQAVDLDASWAEEPRRSALRKSVPNRSELQAALDTAFIESATSNDLKVALGALATRADPDSAPGRRTSY